MARVTRNGNKLSWELDEEEQQIAESAQATRKSTEDSSQLIKETQQLQNEIYTTINSDRYSDRNSRIDLQKKLYQYEANLGRLKGLGYDTSEQIRSIPKIQETVTNRAKLFTQFADEFDYNSWKKYGSMSDMDQTSALEKLKQDMEDLTSRGDTAGAESLKKEIDWLYQKGGDSVRTIGRQDKYEENKKLLEELKQERAAGGYLSDFNYSDYSNANSAYAAYTAKSAQRKKELDEQIDALEAEIRMYERGEGDSGSKVVDDYFGYTQQDDFGTVSANRNFRNPSRIDLQKYDQMNDSSTWRYDAEGNLYDSFGNRIDTSQTDAHGNIINSAASMSQYAVTDRLGMYLSASDAEKQEAAGSVNGTEGTWESVIKDGMDGNWEMLTDKEVDIYYYLLNSSGQETAEKYLSDMKTELNRRYVQQENQSIAEGWDDAGSLEKLALSLATSPVQMVSGAAAFIEDTVNTLSGNDINPYSPAHRGQNFSQMVRGTQAEEFEEATNGAKIPFINFTVGDLYQSGMSIIDMGIGAGLGAKAYGAFMGMSAATSEAARLYQQGASSEQIALGGSLAGAAEMVFETLSIEKLITMKDAETVGQLVKNALIQGGIEASEEGFTEIANIITNSIVMGNQSDWNRELQSNDGDVWKTFLGKVEQVGQASMAGFVAGSGAGGVGSSVNYAGNQIQYTSNGRAIQNTEGGVEALRQLALETASGATEKTQGQINKLSEAVKGDNVSSKKVGRLYRQVENAVSEADQADMRKSLEGKGFSTKEASQIVSAISDSYNGYELTSQQKRTMNRFWDDARVKETVSEIISGSNSEVTKRNRMISAYTYGVNSGAKFSTDTDQKTGQETGSAEPVKQAAQNKYDVSEAGGTIVEGREDSVTIKRIASNDGGNLVLELDDGSTVSADKVSFATQDEAFVYSAIADLGLNADGANLILESYNMEKGNISGEMFANGVRDAYRYGSYNYPISDLEKGVFTSELTENQRKIAYNLGKTFGAQKAAKAEEKVQAKVKAGEKNRAATEKSSAAGKVHYDGDTSGLTQRQKTSISALETVADALGIQIYLFESKMDASGKRVGENGWYDPKDNSIHIDIYAGVQGNDTMLFTAAHELTHQIKEWSPAKFQTLADFLMKEYGKRGISVEELVQAQIAKAKRNGREISYDTAYEEVIADSMETMLADGRVVEKLAKLKQQDRTLWQKMKDIISDLVAKIREAYAGLKPDSREGRYVAEMKDAIEKLQDLFVEGLVSASENYQAATGEQKNTTQDGGEVKYSEKFLASDTNPELLSMVNRVSNGKFKANEKVYLGTVSDEIANKIYELTGIHVNGFHIAIEARQIEHILKDHGANGSSDHSMSDPNNIARMMYTLNDPDDIRNAGKTQAYLYMRDGKNRHADTVLYEKNIGVQSYYVVQAVPDSKAKTLYIVTAFIGKSGYKKEASQLINAKRFDATAKTEAASASKNSIPTEKENVNEKSATREKASKTGLTDTGFKESDIKRSDRDSSGRQLSEEQQKYFQNSVVRDADGNLKTVYHGSPADFNEFSLEYLGTNGTAEGYGFYFTDSKNVAEGYARGTEAQRHQGANGRLYEVYLNITKPLSNTEVTMTRAEFKRFLREMNKQVDEDGEPLDFLSNYGDVEWDGLNNVINFATEIEYDGSDSDVNMIHSIINGCGSMETVFDVLRKTTGYDGIVVQDATWGGDQTIYVAFHPEQAKNISNKNPTTNHDLRYSEREYAYEDIQETEVQQADRDLESDIKFSIRDIEKSFGIRSINDYVGVQKSVIRTLTEEGFFDSEENIVTNTPSGMVVEITKDGIRETLGPGNRFHRLPRITKLLKLATIRSLPEIISSADVIILNEANKHSDKSSLKYSYLRNYVTVDGDNYEVTVTVRVSPQKNKFWIHEVRTEKMEQGLSSSGDLRQQQELKEALVPDEMVSQPDSGVKRSDRDQGTTSDRALLASAFQNIARYPGEERAIQQYQAAVEKMDAEQRKLEGLRGQIKELSFAKGKRDTARIKSLQEEANATANRINTYDRKLLRLSAAKPLQNVLAAERKAAYQKAEQRNKEVMKAYKEKVEDSNRKLAAQYQESRKRGVDSRNRTAMRHKIQGVVSDLDKLLRNGSKDHNVPIQLQKPVAEALDAINMDTTGAEERIAKLQEELLKAKTPEKIQEISRKIDHVREMGENTARRLQDLKIAYDSIINSDDPLVSNAYDEVISQKLGAVIEEVGDTPLRDMTLSQLESVYDMYKAVLTRVRDANKTFKQDKRETVSILGNRVMMEVQKAGGKKKQRISGTENVSTFVWNNLKPVYAFERIGSDTLTGIYNSVRSGEDTWAVDVTEARAFYLEQSKKYGYDSWDFDTRYKFRSASGMDFELNLDQIMSLYAYSKRPQAGDHLRYGGFVFDPNTEVYERKLNGKLKVKVNLSEATAYNLTPETLADIIGKLTPEQRGFADAMQVYLSTVMGEKGNEVSLEMYGIKLFKEKNYFPLKSATQFMAKAKEQAQGEVKIKNSGFSKETVPKARNPIVLSSFMDVWANHVNEMSMYHAFVLPMEDFYRVFNYKTPTSDTMATESVEMYIQNAYGTGATGYIEQLLKDLNGGARMDNRAGFINKWMGKFKKGAVFASLSVTIQQPSAIARAAALVDTKYFIGPKVDSKRHKALWEEVKQYAPVAIIKEMGYFDTNMGKSTKDYITAREYSGISEKMKALVADSGYRDEVLSKAPALADEIAWCGIWEAVKRETVDKHKGLDTKSEAFLKLAGERFTEVITKTQVYDSVLARSANMRSKDTGMNMVTAFMAEPTTSINMIHDALVKGKRGGKENIKYARKAIGAVVAAQILNSILVSFVYAGRDDDDDETYIEKYIGTLAGETLDSLNPLTYIPFIKDIVSIVQGYDVERSDMSVISDFVDACKKLKDEDVSPYRKVEGFAGSICQLFGLPVKNIMRDVRGIYNTVMSFAGGQQTTKAGVKYAVQGAVTGDAVSNQQQLYESYLNGDQVMISRVESRYKDQSAINSAIRSALKENDPRITQAAQAKVNGDLDEYMRIAKEIIGEGHFSQDNVVAAINSVINSMTKDDSNSAGSKASGLFKIADFTEAISQGDSAMANAIKSDIIQTAQKNGKTEEEAEKSFCSSAKTACKEQFLEGGISRAQALKALTDYCGMDQEEAEESVEKWSFEKEYGFSYSDRGDAYKSGEISAAELKQILMDTGGKTEEEAELQIQVYDWQEEVPGCDDITASAIEDYNEYCESVGISKSVYYDAWRTYNDTYGDIDEDGKSVPYSKCIKVMPYIDGLPLSAEQKTALALCWWGESTVNKYKLW